MCDPLFDPLTSICFKFKCGATLIVKLAEFRALGRPLQRPRSETLPILPALVGQISNLHHEVFQHTKR